LLVLGIALSGQGGWLLQIAMWSSALFAVATAGLLWAALWPSTARRLALWIAALLPKRFGSILERLVDGVLTGLAPLAQPAIAFRVLGLSLVAWLIEAAMYIVIMLGFRVPGSAAAGFIGTAAANLASLVPAAPGYAGTFDLALREVLVRLFGASEADAISYTIVVHLTLIVPVVLAGLFFLWRENVSLPELGRHRRLSPEPTVAAGGRGLLKS
jgi:hypothetical protein